MKTYRLIDLFSGCGGMTLGFVDKRFCGGFKSILAIDNNAFAIASHKRNFGPAAECADIEEWLKSRATPEADIVIGGPPCQGFSLLNKKRIGDARRELWQPYLDVVSNSGAKVFVIENVPELLKSDEFVHLADRAKRMGFHVRGWWLNAADYGTPQTRRRTVIFGWKLGEGVLQEISEAPLPTHDKKGVNGLQPWRTVRDAIGNLPPPAGTDFRDVEPPLNLHFGRTPSPVSMERYKAVPIGGNRFDLQKNRPDITPACWIRKKSGGTDLFGRLWWDRPSVTIRTEFFKPEKGRYLHPEQNRPITHREAARLMGFPDDFMFEGTKIEVAKQIGNAVCPPFAGAIANYVFDIMDKYCSV